MNFDNLASGLYGLVPGEFVAERNAAEKQARTAGDRELAARVHGLAKPTVVGWLANQLVRRHPEEIGPLLELGGELREATAGLSREKLQELMRLQHQVIAGLIKQARAIARDAEQRIGEETLRGLEDTLRAALADEALGKQLLEGRLTGALEPVGFGGFAAAPSQSSPPSVAKKASGDQKPAAGKDTLAERRLAKAEQAVTDAKADAQESGAELDRAQRKLEKSADAARELSEKVQALQGKIEELQAELEQAGKQHRDADHAENEAQKRADRWQRQSEQAGRRLDEAVAKRDELLT